MFYIPDCNDIRKQKFATLKAAFFTGILKQCSFAMLNIVVVFINLWKKQVLELLSHWREAIVTVIFWEVDRKSLE